MKKVHSVRAVLVLVFLIGGVSLVQAQNTKSRNIMELIQQKPLQNTQTQQNLDVHSNKINIHITERVKDIIEQSKPKVNLNPPQALELCGQPATALVEPIEGRTDHYKVSITGKICKFSQNGLLIPSSHEAAFSHQGPYSQLYPARNTEAAASPPRNAWYHQYPTQAGGVYSQAEECTGVMIGGLSVLLNSQTPNLCNTMLYAMDKGSNVEIIGYAFHTQIAQERGSLRLKAGVGGGEYLPAALINVRKITVGP